MKKPKWSAEQELSHYLARRHVFALESGANLAILLKEGETEKDAEARAMLQRAERHEFTAWLQEMLEMGLTPSQHRERAMQLKEMAAEEARHWDVCEALRNIAQDHELLAQEFDRPDA
jgi:hypothetical protein